MARRTCALAIALFAIGCGESEPTTRPATAVVPMAKPAVAPVATSVTIAATVVDQANGKGVDGVHVVLRSDGNEFNARTNARGEVELRLPRGMYRAFVRDDRVLSVGLAERVRLDNEPRRELAGVIDESLMAVLDGRTDVRGVELSVVAAATLNGTVLDPLRREVAGAVVRLRPVDQFINRFASVRPVLGTDIAVTARDGTFTLQVPAGEYVLDATHPTLAGVRGTEIVLRAGQRQTTEVGLAPGCIVSGRVVNPDGSPASDGAIERLDPRPGRADGFGPAGRIDAGTFRWSTTEEESVTLRAWPWRSPPSAARTFACKNRKRFGDVMLRVPEQRPDISGTIVDASDRPVPLAYLDVQPLDQVVGQLVGGQQERADAAGVWHVYDMPPSRYQITASAPGLGVVDTVVVAPRHDLRLQLGGTGRIVGTTTELVTGSVHVSFVHCGAKDDPLQIAHEPRIVSVTSGRFVIEQAPACMLALAMRWRDRLIETNVLVEPSRTSYIELDIGEPRPKTVTGVVRDEAGNPVDGARVTAVLHDREAATARTDANGRFTLQTHSGAQLVAGKAGQIGRSVVGRANVPSEHVDVVLDGVEP